MKAGLQMQEREIYEAEYVLGCSLEHVAKSRLVAGKFQDHIGIALPFRCYGFSEFIITVPSRYVFQNTENDYRVDFPEDTVLCRYKKKHIEREIVLHRYTISDLWSQQFIQTQYCAISKECIGSRLGQTKQHNMTIISSIIEPYTPISVVVPEDSFVCTGYTDIDGVYRNPYIILDLGQLQKQVLIEYRNEKTGWHLSDRRISSDQLFEDILWTNRARCDKENIQLCCLQAQKNMDEFFSI